MQRRRPRIALDARATQTGHAGRGIGRVIREFVDAVGSIDDDARAGIVVVGDAKPNPRLENLTARATTWGGLLTPGDVGVAADVVVRLAPTAPSDDDVRTVICCYDLIPLKAMAAHFPMRRRLRHPFHFLAYGYGILSLQRARDVWTISHAVADDVHRLLGVPWSRLHPIGLAPAVLLVPEPARRIILLDALGQKPRGFLLWVLGGTNENKNVEGMMAVMGEPGLPPLVIVGDHPPRARKQIEASARRHRAPRPRFLGHVDNEALASLMHEAHAVVVPSKDEGFGLPVVEARACGAAVVANDIAVLREVGDEGVCYADVASPSSFAAALRAATSSGVPVIARRWTDTALAVLALARQR